MLRHGLRALIGLIMLGSALGKTLDLPDFTAIIGTYEALPAWAWRPAALAAVSAEWIVGLWLMVGSRMRGAAVLSMGMHLFYGAFAAVALVRGIHVANCGCFGIFFPRPLTWGIVIENGVLVFLAFLLWLLARRPEPVEGQYDPPGRIRVEEEE